MFKYSSRLFVALCLLSLVGLQAVNAIDRELARIIKQVFVGEGNYKAVMTAKSATAYVLTPSKERVFGDSSPANYKEEEPVEVSPELLAELKTELKNSSSYSIVTLAEQRKTKATGAMGCLPLYAVRIHFKSESAELGVNFCFTCGDIALSRGEKIFHEANVLRRDAKFLDLCLKLFPEHEGLKKAKTQREANAAAAVERTGKNQ